MWPVWTVFQGAAAPPTSPEAGAAEAAAAAGGGCAVERASQDPGLVAGPQLQFSRPALDAGARVQGGGPPGSSGGVLGGTQPCLSLPGAISQPSSVSYQCLQPVIPNWGLQGVDRVAAVSAVGTVGHFLRSPGSPALGHSRHAASFAPCCGCAPPRRVLGLRPPTVLAAETGALL